VKETPCSGSKTCPPATRQRLGSTVDPGAVARVPVLLVVAETTTGGPTWPIVAFFTGLLAGDA
jgi:hypothetical protein